MEISYIEVKTVLSFLKTRPELLTDDQAEAIAKMAILAGQENSRKLWGNGREKLLPVEENVLGLEACENCGRYLRHICELRNTAANAQGVVAKNECTNDKDTFSLASEPGYPFNKKTGTLPIATARIKLQQLNPDLLISIGINENGRPILFAEKELNPEPDYYEPKPKPCNGCGIKKNPWELILNDDGLFCLSCKGIGIYA